MMNVRLPMATTAPALQGQRKALNPQTVSHRTPADSIRFQGQTGRLWKVAAMGLLPLALLTGGCSNPTAPLEKELQSIPYTQDMTYLYSKFTDTNPSVRIWALNKLQSQDADPYVKLAITLKALRDKDNTVVMAAGELAQHLSSHADWDASTAELLKKVSETYPHKVLTWGLFYYEEQGNSEDFYPAWKALKAIADEKAGAQLEALKAEAQKPSSETPSKPTGMAK